MYEGRPIETLVRKGLFLKRNTIHLHFPYPAVWTADVSTWERDAPQTLKAMKAPFALDISSFELPFDIDSRAQFLFPEGEIVIQGLISIAKERYGRNFIVVARFIADAEDDAENYVTSIEDSIIGTYSEGTAEFERFLNNIQETYANVLDRMIEALSNFTPQTPSSMGPL